ncbi:MAG TPA: hypothetical protein EYP71_02680 [Dehalococcoidia bacterium]|nr:hypothetical protein [Dehalococcoidia bacterium]
MQDLHLLKEHLDRMTQELMEVKKIAIRLETIDQEKAERAWKDLMSASEEISQKWEDPSAVEEIRLQREKKW